MSRIVAQQLAIELARVVAELKSEHVVIHDLRGISSVTDFVVIATGTSDRQVRGLADQVVEHARRVGERPFGLSGREVGTWIILDFVDVVVHLFQPAYRAYYDLDLLWGDAPRIPWEQSATG